ncbi:inovirus-type Gp2 protein [Burkholderia cenocepacia]|uniref:inovirus-type Gp2 protein n=1 Tax=Burkholderia cenocepacia TaxID=95486 RepID=UPI00264A7B4B|nr:inovirus-type Gp2 protein [Burkholderia cenocepacia]MDN7629679.1 inovirus-type Gp2 protein [Burkholderia cenocepacia]
MYEINEDQEALEIIARLDERMNLEETDVNGKKTTIIHKGYASKHLFNIEKFVQGIETGWKGFVDEVTRYGRVQKIRELFLGKRYYQCMNDWLERYSDVHHYSARVDVFYDVCKELGLIGQYPFAFGEPGDLARDDGVRYMDVFNKLIELIRVRCQSREFKERERLRKMNARRDEQRVLGLEDAMFSEETGRSRWLVLSLTLRYKPKFRRWITPETIQEHRERFFAARRFNTLMSGIKNYVWAIEQGEDTGLHLHVILFYTADSNHDEFIAKQIGEYWVDVVTEGKGDYWNSNAEWLKKSYEKRGHGIGVGQINWNDTKKREALRKNLVYLAKSEQYLMITGAERIRTFDMGQVPKKVKAGRPRACVNAQDADTNLTEIVPCSDMDAGAPFGGDHERGQVDRK